MKKHFAFDELIERAKKMTITTLIVYILVSAIGLTAVVITHQWSHDNNVALTQLPFLFAVMLGISASIWIVSYVILKLIAKISGN